MWIWIQFELYLDLHVNCELKLYLNLETLIQYIWTVLQFWFKYKSELNPFLHLHLKSGFKCQLWTQIGSEFGLKYTERELYSDFDLNINLNWICFCIYIWNLDLNVNCELKL